MRKRPPDIAALWLEHSKGSVDALKMEEKRIILMLIRIKRNMIREEYIL